MDDSSDIRFQPEAVALDAPDDIFADIDWPEDQQVNEIIEDDPWPDNASNMACPDLDEDFPTQEFQDETLDLMDDASDAGLPDSDLMQAPIMEDSPTDSNGTTIGSDSQRGGQRFSKEARSVLRVWFHEHKDNPYPNSREKDDLAARSGLKRGQISLWLANTRRRYRSKARTEADLEEIARKPRDALTPYDRWKILPWFQEATAPPVILKAAAENPVPHKEPETITSKTHPASLFSQEQSAGTSQYEAYYAASMASYETGLTSMVNGSSISDTTLNSFPSYAASLSAASRTSDRRRRRHHVPRPSQTGAKTRPFQCTFCHNATFATKYDWQRHEKSQHLSLEKWICCPTSGTVSTPDHDLCAFCGTTDPNTPHLEKHHYSACQGREFSDRTFYRKDHFVQHLKLTHEAKFHPRMESWKTEQTQIRSRCGFCSATFLTWQSRVDHVAMHFKCHYDMSHWVGDLGLDPHVLQQAEKMSRSFETIVTNPTVQQFKLPELPRSQYDTSTAKAVTYQEPLGLPFDAGGAEYSGGVVPTLEDIPDLNLPDLDLSNIDMYDWAVPL